MKRKQKRIRWEEQADGSWEHYRPALSYNGLKVHLTLSPTPIKNGEKIGYKLTMKSITTDVVLLEKVFPSLNVGKRETRKIMEQDNEFEVRSKQEMTA